MPIKWVSPCHGEKVKSKRAWLAWTVWVCQKCWNHSNRVLFEEYKKRKLLPKN